MKDSRRSVFGWVMYDWANSAFTTTVMAGFFPLFFKQFWSAGVDVTVSTARLGVGNSIAGIVIALSAPFLGAIADSGSLRKRFLIVGAYIGVTSTLGLMFVGRGNWIAAAILFIIGALGFSGANIFYDALLTVVSSAKRMNMVSAMGYSLGYLGGGLLFALNVIMTLHPEWFGLSTAETAVRLSFLSVAVWWGLFTIPLILYVREPKNGRNTSYQSLVYSGFHRLGHTIREIRSLKTVSLFLVAYWLYIDGVDTIVRMAVDYGMSLGFDSNDLILALLITQFVGFPAALFFGKVGDRIGAKPAILTAICIYIMVSIWGACLSTSRDFYILAITIGLVQGGIQALSRSFYARIIPAEKSAEYFGFYNMLGKFAVVIGPALIGGVGLLARRMGAQGSVPSRIGITSISLLFVLGGVLLLRVNEQRARQEIQSVEE